MQNKKYISQIVTTDKNTMFYVKYYLNGAYAGIKIKKCDTFLTKGDIYLHFFNTLSSSEALYIYLKELRLHNLDDFRDFFRLHLNFDLIKKYD